MTTNQTTLDELRDALMNSMSPKALGAEGARFAVHVMRELKKGERVPLSRLAARVVATEEQTREMLGAFVSMGFVELDDDGAVLGMVLSVTTANHRFRVGDKLLHAWCALDSLFLPAVIGETAEVESTCVVTGDPIRLRVGADAVLAAMPDDIWVSVVAPGITPGVAASCSGTLAVTDGAFCTRVGFLSSQQAATQWLAAHPHSAVLPLTEAFAFAHAVWAQPFLAAFEETDHLHGAA